METLRQTIKPTTDPSQHMRTPPYTPYRAKRRLERSDSPASITSLKPTDTVSPAKKIAKRSALDNVKVEELVEGDPGYATDLDIVHPEELEERTSGDERTSSSDGESNDSDTGISQRFQELGCEDKGEAKFERQRRQKHLHRRVSSRLFKRTHAQSLKSDDSEISDLDALADHDLSASARRLRRRVKGPSGIEVFKSTPRNSPEPRNTGLIAPVRARKEMRARSGTPDSSSGVGMDGDAMDVDV